MDDVRPERKENWLGRNISTVVIITSSLMLLDGHFALFAVVPRWYMKKSLS